MKQNQHNKNNKSSIVLYNKKQQNDIILHIKKQQSWSASVNFYKKIIKATKFLINSAFGLIW